MARWIDKADEVQSLIDKGYTNKQLAKHFNVSEKTIKNTLPVLERGGYIQRPQNRTQVQQEAIKGYKESLDISKDGSYTSDKPLWMTLDQVKDPEYLMRAHGFEPDAWELVSAKNNIWNTNDKVHGIQTLYASKITVKPRVQTWTIDELLSVIRADVKPVHIEFKESRLRDHRMLEIPMYDQHWGNAFYEDYKETQRDTYELIESRTWEEILIVLGSDMFHANNFNSTTVSGTQLETTDIPKAWGDCLLFYSPLIENAIRRSNGHTKVIWIPGNHDAFIGWAFVQMLKVKYPQVEFDDNIKTRKAYTYGYNFIGLAHGDKARKDLIRIFPAEFPMEWSQTTNREAHIGHLHREEEVRGKDEFGMTIRTLSTKNPIDQYHDDNGYVTAHRRFMLFEYDQERLRHIHYV